MVTVLLATMHSTISGQHTQHRISISTLVLLVTILSLMISILLVGLSLTLRSSGHQISSWRTLHSSVWTTSTLVTHSTMLTTAVLTFVLLQVFRTYLLSRSIAVLTLRYRAILVLMALFGHVHVSTQCVLTLISNL